METNTLDGGQIAILAIAALMAGMALRTWLGGAKSQTTPEPELLVQIRNELREANGSLTRLKSTVAQQQVALDATKQDIAAMRRSAEDHAGDMKSAIENVSAAIDAGRAETNARHEAMSNRLDEIGAATADAKDNTAAILESVGGLRGRMDTISDQARAIPPLADRIDHLQHNVASIAEATNKPKPTTPARARKTATNSRRGKGKRAGRTAEAPAAAVTEAPAGAATPPQVEPQPTKTTDAGKPAERSDGTDVAGNSAADTGAIPTEAADDTGNAPPTAADAPGDGQQTEAI